MSESKNNPPEIPKAARFALFGGGVLALAGAGVIGMDLMRGLREGVFLLARHPITAESGTRFQLAAFGEGFAVLVLLVLGVALIIASCRLGRT
jgi:hypothetical protein